jgi:hypothetical protein
MPVPRTGALRRRGDRQNLDREANSRVVTFAYEVRLADSDTVLATGSTRHLFVNRQMERTRMPDKYRPLFGLDEQGGRH